MLSIKKYFTFVCLLCVSSAFAQNTTDWRTNGLEVEVSVDGGDYETFFAKGMAYSPSPVGDGGANAAPFNDFFYRHPDLPEAVEQYRAIWRRDIGDSENPGFLRQMGVNSIRTYSMLKHLYVDFTRYDNNGNPLPIWDRVDSLDWSTDTPPIEQWYVHHGHDAFLDMCWNDGVDPIYVWICIPFDDIFFGHAADQVARDLKDRQFRFFKNTAEWLAKSYGDHPAVKGFILGNEHDGEVAPDSSLKGTGIIDTLFGEMDFSNPNAFPVIPAGGWPPEVAIATNGERPMRRGDSRVYDGYPIGGTTWRTSYWDKLNEIHDAIKEHAPTKLTTTSLHDDPNILIHWLGEVDEAAGTLTVLEQTPREYAKVDVWGFNTYNVPGRGGNIFPRYQEAVVEYAAQTNQPEVLRPLILTELGVPASTREGEPSGVLDDTDRRTQPAIELPNKAQEAAELIIEMWDSVEENSILHRSGNVASGAYIFEYSDEWWKHGTPTVHNGGGSRTGGFPGHYWDEEWFGIMAVAPSVARQPLGNGQNSSTPLNERPVIDERNGDLNGGPDTLTPRAAFDMLSAAFQGSNPLRRGGAASVGGGAGDSIRFSDWYGYFYDGAFPWVFSYNMGWQYVEGNTDEALYLYDLTIGWLYTSDDVFPYLYSFQYQDWTYYNSETDSFYFSQSEQVIPDID